MSLLRGVLRLAAFAFNLVLGLFLLGVGLLGWWSGETVRLDVIPLVEGEDLVLTLLAAGLFALLTIVLALPQSRFGAVPMLLWDLLVVGILICAFTRSSYTFAGIDHFLNLVYGFLVSVLALLGSWIHLRAVRQRRRAA